MNPASLSMRLPAQLLRCGRARRLAMLQGDEPLREHVRQAASLHVGDCPPVHTGAPQHMRHAQHDRIARKRQRRLTLEGRFELEGANAPVPCRLTQQRRIGMHLQGVAVCPHTQQRRWLLANHVHPARVNAHVMGVFVLVDDDVVVLGEHVYSANIQGGPKF